MELVKNEIGLSVSERAILLNILPKEGDYLTFKILKELKLQVAFSEEDLVNYEIKQENDMLMWNRQKETEKIINIGDKGKEIIVNVLKKLNEEKKINDMNVTLYEKFIKE
jgi:hypothetical protein